MTSKTSRSAAETALFIIPARGGSKGIPGKNIKPLAGRPLIHYAIATAREVAGDDSRVIVTTDSPEIRDVARLTGLPVDYLRPAELATDTAGSREVMLDAMAYADAQGIRYDKVVLLQPTSPLRTTADVIGALDLYHPGLDMVVSVTEASCNPFYDCFLTDPEGLLHVAMGDGLYTRRQDAPKAWQYNGAVYVINPESLRAMPLGAFPRRVPFVMPRSRSIDLDTLVDWQIAEQILTHKAPTP